ncbi:hypothetical protein [Streptomyces uncialis]|uniref:Uncharacterized protein n=1 Tax=Streptomyces uncialis TaxID=1048205 RepID=A0A1Q4USM8_9ACTN|nr:hypothetical protein [Streptomyces uncialis]OKH88479.1 hypothetical protein AB852_36435 [Streptomyces uncialis]
MTAHNELRLLPWSGPEGKPCFLSTDDGAGFLSRLADTTEASQLSTGAEVLKRAVNVLADGEVAPEELRPVMAELIGSLRDVLRVAESRGHRLPAQDSAEDSDDEEGPHLPAAAFG